MKKYCIYANFNGNKNTFSTTKTKNSITEYEFENERDYNLALKTIGICGNFPQSGCWVTNLKIGKE